MMSGLDQAVQSLRAASRVLILTHISPDGDGLGSSLALAGGLRQLGKQAWVLAAGVPKIYAFLALDAYALPKEGAPAADLAVSLDCPCPERLGDAFEKFKAAPSTLVLDHHADSRPFGAANWLDEKAAATGEMVGTLLKSLGVSLNPEMATGLYLALVTDTGSFRYSNTRPATLRLAAELVEAGAVPYDIGRRLFESYPLSSLRLLGRALSRLELLAGGRLAVLKMPLDVFTECGAKEEESELLTSFIRVLDGVEAAAFLRECSQGGVRVSFRSKGGLDVQAVASQFGGGGHKAAAGASLEGPLDAAAEKVSAALCQALG